MKKVLLTMVCALVAIGCFGQGELLEKAFNRRSPRLAKKFFAEWQRELPPITDAELELSSDTLQNIYAIYRMVIKPLSDGAKFYPVQDTVNIQFTDFICYAPVKSDSLWYYVLSKVPHPDKLVTRSLESYRETGATEGFHILKALLYGGYCVGDDVVWDINNTSKLICMRDLRPQADQSGLPYTAKYRHVINKYQSEYSTHKLKNYRKNYFLGRLFYYNHVIYSAGIHNILFDRDMKYAIVRYEDKDALYASVMKNDNGHWRVLSTNKPLKKRWTKDQSRYRRINKYIVRRADSQL